MKREEHCLEGAILLRKGTVEGAAWNFARWRSLALRVIHWKLGCIEQAASKAQTFAPPVSDDLTPFSEKS